MEMWIRWFRSARQSVSVNDKDYGTKQTGIGNLSVRGRHLAKTEALCLPTLSTERTLSVPLTNTDSVLRGYDGTDNASGAESGVRACHTAVLS